MKGKWINMARSLISKDLLELLEKNAPKDYDVKDNFFDIQLYKEDEAKELFDILYLTSDKKEEAAYLLKLVEGVSLYKQEDLEHEEIGGLSVREKLINDHRRAAVIELDGERSYVHYS